MKETIPRVETEMLIRRPVSKVYEAFINPAITTQFWITKSTGPLETGKTVTWEWEMYGATAVVSVRELIENRKISFSWGDPATIVDLEFLEVNGASTYVKIRHYGFSETGDALLTAVKDSTGGFTLLLAGLKAYLEYDIRLNLVADKYPQEIRKPKF